MIAPRSGLAVKHFIDVGAGVVDFDYRGNVGVVLFNHSEEDFVVTRGDRVAQLILESISMASVEEVLELDDTTRGASGFGSTGISTIASDDTSSSSSSSVETKSSSPKRSLDSLEATSSGCSDTIKIQKLTDFATMPTRGSPFAAGSLHIHQ